MHKAKTPASAVSELPFDLAAAPAAAVTGALEKVQQTKGASAVLDSFTLGVYSADEGPAIEFLFGESGDQTTRCILATKSCKDL